MQRLKEMDINIIEDTGAGKDFSGIKSEDVVILPAFGASVQEMKMLSEKGVQLVDTTCPWVAKVRPSLRLCFCRACELCALSSCILPGPAYLT